MKFCVNFINGQGCRLGVLSGLQSNPEKCYETPFFVATTKGGSIPHLTQGIFHNSFSKDMPLCVPVQHFSHYQDVLQEFMGGVSCFSSLETHPVCATIQDPTQSTPNGFNTGTAVSVWSNTGRHQLCSKKFTNLIEVINPDWYEILNDADTDSQSSKKRIEKSLRNSLKFLNECLQLRKEKMLENIGVFCPLLGGHNVKDRSKWSEDVKEQAVDGFMLLGLHSNGTAAEDLQTNNLKELVNASLENLPAEKPRQALGAFNALVVLDLIECGIDIFDSSLPCLATERGAALCFPNSFDAPFRPEINSVVGMTPNILVSENNSHSKEGEIIGDKSDSATEAACVKKKRVEGSNVVDICHYSPVEEVDEKETKKETFYEINLKNRKYFDSKDPVLEGCTCYTCRAFTKSYIHHLLSVREMLADVLLMIHNLHHWVVFFTTIKIAIKTERWDELKKLVALSTKYKDF